MPTLKNKGHERFAQAIAAGKNGTDAYLAAGYAISRDAAARNAYRLRNRDDVKARIAELASGKDKGSGTAQLSPSTVETALRKKTGRPSLYRPEYADQAFKYALLGAIDDELARLFGVAPMTIENWKAAHPEFLDAIQNGKEKADATIAHSLYRRAKGYGWTEQQAFKVKRGKDQEAVEVVEVERSVPPDTAAAFIWLKNRRRRDWRDKHELEVTGRYVDMNDEQRLAWAQNVLDRAYRLLGASTIEHDPEDGEERDLE